jgi:hypothetical protein
MAGEVLSVDEDHFVAEAKKHAELNGITGCQYFGGKPDELLPVIATKITCMKACAIVIGTSNHFSTCELVVIFVCHCSLTPRSRALEMPLLSLLVEKFPALLST